MLTCYIIEDTSTQELLSGFIDKLTNLSVTGSSDNVELDFGEILQLHPDIIFTNVSYARRHKELFKSLPKTASVIYTSDTEEGAYYALKNNCVDFLIKPIQNEDFLSSIVKVQHFKINELSKRVSNIPGKDHFFIKCETKSSRKVRVTLEYVVLVESLENYVKFHMTEGKSIISYLTLKEVEEKLPGHLFTRISKSAIININQIESTEGNRITLSNEITVAVGPTYRETFFEGIQLRTFRTERNKRRIA